MKKNYIFFIVYCLGFLGFSACKEDLDKTPEIASFLDVNIRFPGDIKPEVGNTLVISVFHQDVTGKSHKTLVADEQVKIVLSDRDISEGFRITFEDFDRTSGTAQLFASVDINDDGELNDMDLATFYNGISLGDVESGEATPKNIVQDYAITVNVDKFIGGEISEDDEVRDVDGNVYETVIIGDQQWLKENLKVTRYNNGDPIPTGLSNTEWAQATYGAYSIYPHADIEGINSQQEMLDTYGLLYNWYVNENPSNICPIGWKVPSDEDWKELELYIGMTEAQVNTGDWRGTMAEVLKTTYGWIENATTVGTDEYGFSALPGGQKNNSGVYGSIGVLGLYWTSSVSESNPNNAFRRGFRNNYVSILRTSFSKNTGHCIRCLKIQ